MTDRKPTCVACKGAGGGATYTAGTGIKIESNEISADTTVLQPKLTAGDGIDITNDVISVVGSGWKLVDPATTNNFHDLVDTTQGNVTKDEYIICVYGNISADSTALCGIAYQYVPKNFQLSYYGAYNMNIGYHVGDFIGAMSIPLYSIFNAQNFLYADSYITQNSVNSNGVVTIGTKYKSKTIDKRGDYVVADATKLNVLVFERE